MRRGIFATRTQKTWVPCLSPFSWRENAHITESEPGAGAGAEAGAEAGPGVALPERLLCVVNNDLRRFVSWVMTSSQPPFMSSSISLILCQTCKLHGAFRTCDLFSHANFPRKNENPSRSANPATSSSLFKQPANPKGFTISRLSLHSAQSGLNWKNAIDFYILKLSKSF